MISFNNESTFFERNRERIFTRAEVIEKISQFVERPVLVRELFDQHGLYLLEMKKEGKPGEHIEFMYLRKGKFPNGQEAQVTTIIFANCEDGISFDGGTLADYDAERNEWVDK